MAGRGRGRSVAPEKRRVSGGESAAAATPGYGYSDVETTNMGM